MPTHDHIHRILANNPALRRALTPRLTKYIPHTPTVKQSAFLVLPVLDGFYGGAAGGGKSDALLMASLQYVDLPGYHALLLRRTYKELSLPSALMDRSMQWLRGTDAKWNSTKYRWSFPSGSSLTFGHLQHRADVYEYDSSEFQFIGFDELTQFEEFQFRFMFNRLRRLKGSNIPVRMRSASNPGGLGHLWVKDRYVAHPGHHGRIYIPALLDDNQYVDATSYSRSLEELDPVARQQRRWGDWDATYEGTTFRREWFQRFVQAPPSQVRRCRFWDLAATDSGGDWTVGTKMSTDDAGQWFVEDVQRVQYSPGKVERLIHNVSQVDGRGCMVRIEQEPGASGKSLVHRYIDILAGYDVSGRPATGRKEVRWRPFAAQAEVGNVAIVSAPWNNVWIDELCAVPNTPHDDQADSVAGAFTELCSTIPEYFGVEFLTGVNRHASNQ